MGLSYPSRSNLTQAMTAATDSDHALDLDRHAGLDSPDADIPKPQLGSRFEVDPAVVKGMMFVLHQSWDGY